MFTREERECERFSEANEKVTDLAMRETRSGSLFSVVMGLFTQLGPLLIYFAGGARALDSISENAIQQALDHLMVNRTSVVIAHRLSTILKADGILVVQDGLIAERGTHEELLELGGVYNELFYTQFSHVLETNSATRQTAFNVQSFGTQFDMRRLTEAGVGSSIFADVLLMN